MQASGTRALCGSQALALPGCSGMRPEPSTCPRVCAVGSGPGAWGRSQQPSRLLCHSQHLGQRPPPPCLGVGKRKRLPSDFSDLVWVGGGHGGRWGRQRENRLGMGEGQAWSGLLCVRVAGVDSGCTVTSQEWQVQPRGQLASRDSALVTCMAG